MPRVRVHQHVNPLAPYYRQEPQPVVLAEVFADPERPLHLDIGCARGRFIRRMAEVETAWNFLGVEIREPLVTEANRLACEAGLTNLYYEFCNAMLWLDTLMSKIPEGRLQMVTIQFPDPWFKKKHAKRRMVTRELIETVLSRLAAGGKIFVQTDIEFLGAEIFEMLSGDERLKEVKIAGNPFAVRTEREKAVEDKAFPVFRRMWLKQ
jgi:tRNA (guanine-N7-)-methyltransferase